MGRINQKLIDVKQLKELTIALLVKSGLSKDQSEMVATCFTTADLYGVSTHGVAVLPAHIKKIMSGGYNLSPEFKIIREGGAFAVIDGDNAIGPVSAVHCINYAMERCKEMGVYTVLSRNNNTYGPAFYYPLLAAEKGYIGITMCNSPSAMAPIGGKDKLLGTNPFAVVIPCKRNQPIILDMATSVVAKSKINEYRKAGEKIPQDWALDENGNPTTDPLEAIKGLVLPMAGFKGYGISMMIDVLAGALSGASFLNHVGKFYSQDNRCMNVGYSFILIDPRQVFGEEFYDMMDEYANAIRNSQPLDQGQCVCLPGDDRIDKMVYALKNGIELSDDIFDFITQ